MIVSCACTYPNVMSLPSHGGLSWVGGHPSAGPARPQEVGVAPPGSYLVDAWLALAVECARLHVLRHQAQGVQDVQCKAFLLRSQTINRRGLGLWSGARGWVLGSFVLLSPRHPYPQPGWRPGLPATGGMGRGWAALVLVMAPCPPLPPLHLQPLSSAASLL